MKKSCRVKITAKIKNCNGEMHECTSTKKTKVLRLAQVQKIKSAYLRVAYGGGLSNEGDFPNYEEFKKALNAFTESALIDGGHDA